MGNLSKEDIQAIAQELRKIQAEQCADTRAQQSQNMRGQKPKKNTSGEGQPTQKNIVAMGIILVWALVFVVLAIKLAPYI